MTHTPHSHGEIRKHSREEQAKIEIGHTESTPAVNRVLTLVFLAVIVAVPLLQTAREAPALPQWCEVFTFLWPKPAELKAVARGGGAGGRFAAGKALNERLLRDIANYERELKDRDTLVQRLIPRMQTVITGWLRGGNEDAYCGRDGWLFYRRDIDSLTGRGFLEPAVLRQRAATGSEVRAPPQPDPLLAIVEFRDQLAARGIALIVVPAPVKPSLHPEFHSRRYAGRSVVVQNPSFAAFKRRLADARVAVFDPSDLLAEAKARAPAAPLYLKTDTHWTPAAMELTAVGLAAFARRTVVLPAPQEARFTAVGKAVTALGDVAQMLKLPAGQQAFPPEQVRVRQVLDGNGPWRPAAAAEVLLLGDSFANIYSLAPMGWGEGAGFAEHLSLALGLPVDAICRNDAGSHATRQMLANELQRGHDRLAGKQLVIWEFAARELAGGDWKRLPLALGTRTAAGFYAPAAGRTVDVRAVVRAASPAPRPGSVPYKDHILMLHLAELATAEDPSAAGREAVAFAWSMRDNRPSPASRYRPGDAVRLRLRPWSEVSPACERINRSELDDERLQLAEAAWVVEADSQEGGGRPAAGAATDAAATRPGAGAAAPGVAAPSDRSPAVGAAPAEDDAAARFRLLCARQAAEGDSMAVAGADGWLFLRSELRHIGVGVFWGAAAAQVSRAASPDKADPLPAIVDFHEQLKALGIELIVAPVPCKALVYPELIGASATGRLDAVHRDFLRLLGARGVKVLDLAAAFHREQARPGRPLLYCKTDSHWSPYACEVTAARIREALGAPAWLRGRPEAFKTSPEVRTIAGDLADGGAAEELPARVVDAAGAALDDRASPIILLGDSHTLVFHAGAELHGVGAGLADQLAAELGLAVDVIGVRGSGATPARVNLLRRARADAAYLGGKKVVIWCFAARAFTESTGWSMLKITK